MAFLDFLSGGILSGFEVGTSKKQETTTNTSTYSPTINRTYDFQYNIASDGSTISTKKEQAITQTPEISPSVSVVPTLSTSKSSEDEGTSFNDIAIIGVLVIGAVLIIPPLVSSTHSLIKTQTKEMTRGKNKK